MGYNVLMNIRRDVIKVVFHSKLFFEGNYFFLEEYDMPQETADGLEKILQAHQGFSKTFLLSGNNEWKLQPKENVATVSVGSVDQSGEEDYYATVNFGIDFKTGKVFFTGAEDY